MRNHRYPVVAILVLLAGLTACQKASKNNKDKPATGSNQGSGQGMAKGSGSGASAPVADAKDIDSKDILARTETSPEVFVKHVLLGWKELESVYRGRLDPRAAKRSNAETATLAQGIAAKLKANPDSIDALIEESSEDPGSKSGEPYAVKPDGQFVPEFKNLALRLKEKEVGIVKTQFGYHVMIRVPAPAPDPLESADILARPPEAGPVKVQQIVIGWKGTPSAGAGSGSGASRTKADAGKLAKEVLDKVRAKGDMAKLIKEYSEDPGSKDSARGINIAAEMQVPDQFKSFKDLALRLKVDEAGLAKSPLGYHILKRLPPPPPDPLDSADILKREPQGAKVKVKHILLGWTEVNSQDERAQKRDRKTLEKLVRETVAKLKKGAKIEPLMAELSEDPGSAKAGTSYDVTPDAGLVPPFKNLSLRLKAGEVGVVKTDFGIHIIQRTE
jgi:parvulin-like peptidyl-prolyl isomerase